MGLFDSIVGAAMGQLQQQGGLAGALGGLLANDGATGGLSGLTEKFNQAGLGEQLRSWIGSGHNLPISADQIQQVLGSDTVRNIAAQRGVDTDQAAQQLSSLLPGLVDRLTPNGEAPANGLGNAGDLLGILGGLLRK